MPTGGLQTPSVRSSASVYGTNTRISFRSSDNVDHPLNLYGPAKEFDELIANGYAPVRPAATGSRFFVVKEPWGRPDMSMWLFSATIRDGNAVRLLSGV
jgi:UDP-glucuronate 4-epimerase